LGFFHLIGVLIQARFDKDSLDKDLQQTDLDNFGAFRQAPKNIASLSQKRKIVFFAPSENLKSIKKIQNHSSGLLM
jgi:hypothetical protein